MIVVSRAARKTEAQREDMIIAVSRVVRVVSGSGCVCTSSPFGLDVGGNEVGSASGSREEDSRVVEREPFGMSFEGMVVLLLEGFESSLSFVVVSIPIPIFPPSPSTLLSPSSISFSSISAILSIYFPILSSFHHPKS